MRSLQRLVLVVCLCLSFHALHSQDKLNIKFGNITLRDFDLSAHRIDSNAAAVVISDIGDCYYTMGTLVMTRHRRMKIINSKGFDAAKVEIPLYINGMKGQHISKLKASTYNVENGNIQETKLDSKSIYNQKVSGNVEMVKFTFPAIHPGSVVEYSYEVESPNTFNISSWEFQGFYPCLWSEFSVSIPEYYNFVFLSQGYLPYYEKPNKTDPQYHGSYRWVMKDVPAIKEEPYTTTLQNHVAKIEFQLSSVWTSAGFQDILSSWPRIGKLLMENEYFGAGIEKGNGWLDDEIKKITGGARNDVDKAKMLFAWVRDNCSCTQNSGILAYTPLKTVYKNKTGTESELNLLLSAMLNHEKIFSRPVILSTRDNGYANEIYPLITRYNYVVCYASIDSNDYFLDASIPVNGFNRLPGYCYNGQARIISEENSVPVYFMPDSLHEQKITNVLIINDEKGFPTGSFQSTLGYSESSAIREKLRKKSKNDFYKELLKALGPDLKIDSIQMDSLTSYDDRVAIHYDFDLKSFSGKNLIYFNPLFLDDDRENPFKTVMREYPVEMPCEIDKAYLLEMEIPDGFVVEELPKSLKLSLNENDGYFEYLVQKNDHSVQMRSRIKLNKTFFRPEEYAALRDFYADIVKKQNELIVFRKKTVADANPDHPDAQQTAYTVRTKRLIEPALSQPNLKINK